MNGEIDGEIVMNAAIYQKQVCEVCLNCDRGECTHAIRGCEAFRAALAAHTRRYRRRGGGSGEAKEQGRDHAAGMGTAV